jgi:general secretion pathway protein D
MSEMDLVPGETAFDEAQRGARAVVEMHTPSPRRAEPRWRRGAIAASALALVALTPAVVAAQPSTRGAPVLRTPGPNVGAPSARPGAAGTTGAAPAAPTPAAPGATGNDAAKPPAGGAGEVPEELMNGVKQGPKEIEFRPKAGGALVSFNLDDADLPELVKAISNITGRRFIYGGKLRQIKATVYSPEKVTVAEAYSAFLSILETNGMTVIPHGRFLKIVETPGIASQTTPVIGVATPVPGEDRFVTRLYRVSNVDATEVANVLGKFKSKEGDVTVYAPGNLLVLTDTGSNIQRMLRIVEEVDVGSAGDQLFVEPVHYGQATELANKLNEILDLKGGAGGGGRGGKGAAGASGGPAGARIVADDRTNSLVITSTQGDYMRLLELIKRIDVPQSGEGEIHVLPLQHAACKDLSQTLNQILGGAMGATGLGARPAGSTGATGARPIGATGARGASVQEAIFEGTIRISCDEATNSLVTTSSLRDYAQLKPVIDRLDMPRRQVFIEAVIMDVSVDRSTDIGLGYHAGAPISLLDKNDSVFYGGNNPGQSILGVPANLEALALGVRGPAIEGSSNLFGTGVSIPALGVVMHALGKSGDSNVLATPHILATDNIAAEISIGQNIPLQTNIGGIGSLAGLAGGAAGAAGAAGGLGGLGLLGGLGGFQAPRQDIGTKIKVIPHVNDSDQVRLELTEEISDAGSPIGAIGAIPINKRTANTTLIVRDQQTVVIGGLVRDRVTHGITKIPVLGDIPVLGVLFRQSQSQNQKSNLLLVLTPYIIRDQDDLRAVFERKMQERQEFLDRYFVFNEDNAWTPPRDYSRANGLVEDIRQSMIKMDEKERLERDTLAKHGPRTHETPAQPIPLPALGGAGGRGDAGEAAAPAKNAPATTNTGARPAGRRQLQLAPGRNRVQRVE